MNFGALKAGWHNFHERDHGPGAHLDSLETDDERRILPGMFGVRLEFDIYLQPDGKALLTGGKQDQLITI
jgi:Xaa-Pro dipeptidase